jgi:hypothetical protein
MTEPPPTARTASTFSFRQAAAAARTWLTARVGLDAAEVHEGDAVFAQGGDDLVAEAAPLDAAAAVEEEDAARAEVL